MRSTRGRLCAIGLPLFLIPLLVDFAGTSRAETPSATTSEDTDAIVVGETPDPGAEAMATPVCDAPVADGVELTAAQECELALLREARAENERLRELLGFMPYFPGVILRYEFYRFALAGCGRNVVIEFGVSFTYRDITLGSNVLIGRYCVIHECDIGDDVLIGERCTFLSGMKQHRHGRTDIPMTRQGGERKRIAVGNDCWIGSHSIVMEDVADGCVIGAGAVVNKPVPALSIAAGNPARILRSRGGDS